MFIEDIGQDIMPIGGESRNYPDFSIVLEKETPEDNDILRVAFSLNDRPERTLTEAGSKFITDIARHLAYKGEIFCEIINSNPNDFKHEIRFQNEKLANDSARLFQLAPIPGKVIKIARYYFQFIPKTEWASLKKIMVAIPSESVWLTRLPVQLGNKSSHIRLLKALTKYNSPLPDFIKFDLKDNTSWKNFNFNDFHKYSDLRIAMETAKWGWPGRQVFENNMLQYHIIYRHLRFAYSLAILREHILLSINDMLKQRSFSSPLFVKGLPTSDNLKDAISKLELGEISFKDALDLTNLM